MFKFQWNKYDLGLATLCILILFSIPFAFYINQIEFIHQFEESAGYRYFYSLRYAFGHEIVWLPQGQIVTLYHSILQSMLTFLGLPNEQLLPRVWYFCVAVNILPIFLSWMALVQLSSQFECKIWSLLLMTFFVFLMSSNGLPGGASWLLLPDYHIWVLPLTIYSASLLLLDDKDPELDKPNLRYIKYGVLIGLSASVKITFVLIPISVLLVDLFSRPRSVLQTTKLLLVSFLISLVITLSIFYIMVHCISLAEFWKYLQQNIAFSIQGNGGMSAVSFKEIFIESWFVFLLIIIFSVYACVSQRKLIGVAVVGFLYTCFIIRRFYSHSFIEYHAYALIPLALIVYLLSSHRSMDEYKQVKLLPYAIVVLLFFATMPHFNFKKIHDIQEHHRMISRAASNFHDALQKGPSPVWILTSDNSYRPYTIESALCKGGMNINSIHWGIDSPYIAALFPNFKCAIYSHFLSNEEKKMVPMGTIGFAGYLTEDFKTIIKRIEKDFEISLAKSECKEVADSNAQRLIYCYPKHLS